MLALPQYHIFLQNRATKSHDSHEAVENKASIIQTWKHEGSTTLKLACCKRRDPEKRVKCFVLRSTLKPSKPIVRTGRVTAHRVYTHIQTERAGAEWKTSKTSNTKMAKLAASSNMSLFDAPKERNSSRIDCVSRDNRAVVILKLSSYRLANLHCVFLSRPHSAGL